MSFTRSSLTRGTGYLTYNAHIFEVRDRIVARSAPTWNDVQTSMFGPIDQVKVDNIIQIDATLWGAWENLSDIFPSYAMNPIPGTSVFGTTDKPLGIQGRNNDLVTYANAAVTSLAGLYLGTDNDLFAAAVRFTCLIANGANPEDSGSYMTVATNAYSAATEAFAKTNFKRTRFTGAWGSITGFTAMNPQKGVQASWDLGLDPFKVDGYGTVDMTVRRMIGMMKAVPIGPTMAQLKTNSQQETAHGTQASAISADLVWTGANSGPVVTLKNASLNSNDIVFDPNDLRVGEVTWRGTRGFSSGAPAVAASVA